MGKYKGRQQFSFSGPLRSIFNMNALVVISACICAAAGRPQYPINYAGYPAFDAYGAVAPILGPTSYEYNLIADTAPVPAHIPSYYNIAPAVAPTEYKNQYHSQDEFGQYAYGHASLGQTHNAVRDYTGAVRGSYSYLDANNEEVIVHYIADQDGFRVSSNALPVAPTFDAVAPVAPEVKLEAPVFNLEAPVFDLEAPVFDLEQVEDTPEVAEARAEHFRLVEEHKAAVAAAMAAAAAATEEPAMEETTEAAVAEEEEVVEEVAEEVAEEETVTEAAEAATEAPAEEEVAAEETVERRKRQVINYLPQFYNAQVAPVSHVVRDAELLRVVHNPNHGVSYRVL